MTLANVNNETFVLLLKIVTAIITFCIIPLFVHIIKIFLSWNVYVYDWSSTYNKGKCENIWFFFECFTFSRGTDKFWQNKYISDIKEKKLRYKILFEKYVRFRANVQCKKVSKMQKIQYKKEIKEQINYVIPGFLD